MKTTALINDFLTVEENFDFRNRLADLHPNRLSSDALPLASNETEISDKWIICPLSENAVVLHAADDLSSYFSKSLGIAVQIVKNIGSANATHVITVSVKPEENERTSRITVSDSRIDISGATAREAMHGCYRLEDELSSRGKPFAKQGERTYTRMFSPRYSHSAWEIEKFPDVYLDQMAHAGMDAILVFISDPPNMTHNGPCDLNAEADRTAVHGIDVYAYTHFPQKSAKMHPLDPGAEEWYDEIYGSIPKMFPKIRGMIAVGESSAFPSRDPKASGFWWTLKNGDNGDYKRLNGFTPSLDWADWLKLVTKVTRKYKPGLEFVFWTYNWFWTPEDERLALLSVIPDDVTVHVTFEMGDKPREKGGVSMQVDDYSITSPGPGTTFSGEAQLCGKRGIKVSTMSNTAGRTWDYGILPYEPAPRHWLARFKAMRKAAKDWGLSGTMDSHHFGFWPSFISELAKTAFTEETTDEDLDRRLAEIATRDWGRENTETILAAWNDLDDAFDWHSARNFDQYGPLRVGPVYPMFLPNEKIPFSPKYESNVESFSQEGRGWKYVFPEYRMPIEEADKWIEIGKNELNHIDLAIEKLEKAFDSVPASKREGAARFIGLVTFMRAAAQTLQHARMFKKEGAILIDETQPAAARKAASEALLKIIDEERENVTIALECARHDSALGFEPSMGYVADPFCLEWKLRDLQRAKDSVLKY